MLVSGSLVSAKIPSSVDSATFVSNPRAAAPAWLKTEGNKSPGRILSGYKLKYSHSSNMEIISSVFATFRDNEENRPFNFLDESGASYGGRLLTRYSKDSGKIDYKITGGSNLFFELYNNSIFENEGKNDFSGNQLPGIPASNFTGSTDMKTSYGLHFQMEVISSEKIPIDDFNSRYTDPWTVLNARAGYSFSLKNKWGVDVMFLINNITDARYASLVVVNAPGTETRPPRYYYPGMPRWVTFTVGLKYRIERD